MSKFKTIEKIIGIITGYLTLVSGGYYLLFANNTDRGLLYLILCYLIYIDLYGFK